MSAPELSPRRVLVVDALAHAHGGELTAGTTVVGATFTLTVPH